MKKSEKFYKQECENWISERVEIIKYERSEIEYLSKQIIHLNIIRHKKNQSVNLSLEHLREFAKENDLTSFLDLCNGKKSTIKPHAPKPPKAIKIRERGQIYRSFEKMFKFVTR